MSVEQIPLFKGSKKTWKDLDWSAALPVNMLVTAGEVLNSSYSMHTFPGVVVHSWPLSDGLSRGVVMNTAVNAEYRANGHQLVRRTGAGTTEMIIPEGVQERVALPFSAKSQAVTAGGVLTMWPYGESLPVTLTNWPDPLPQWEIGVVLDACWIRGYYCWVKSGTNTFGVTDIEDETHPDRYRPFYSAESQPDGAMGCLTWRDYIVIFGRSSVEYFSLTGATDAQEPLFVAQPPLMLNKGICGTWCKTLFMGEIVILGNSAGEPPSVWVIGSGQAQNIATITIEKILRGYSEYDLSQSVLESFHIDGHDLLLVHLPDRTLCYDASSSKNGPQWCDLNTGATGYTGSEPQPYNAVIDTRFVLRDFSYFNGEITCTNTRGASLMKLDTSIAGHGQNNQNEFLFCTPIMKADNAIASDLELEFSTGGVTYLHDNFGLNDGLRMRVFVSATTDGVNYGREAIMDAGRSFQYDRRVRLARVGRVRKNIGFRFRIVTASPFSVTGCSVRFD